MSQKWRLAQVAKRPDIADSPRGCRAFPSGVTSWSQDSGHPRSKNPSYLGVDLRIAQLRGEGAVGTTWPRMHLHGHFSLTKRLDPTAEKGPQNLHTHQSSLQQSQNDLPQGLQPTKVRLSHPIPQLGWGMGRLHVNTRSGASVLFLRKIHALCHQTRGSDIRR
jgi:hypothetical protein